MTIEPLQTSTIFFELQIKGKHEVCKFDVNTIKLWFKEKIFFIMTTISAHLKTSFHHSWGGISKLYTIISKHANYRHFSYPLLHLFTVTPCSHSQSLLCSKSGNFALWLCILPKLVNYGRTCYSTWARLNTSAWIIPRCVSDFLAGRLGRIFWETSRVWSTTGLGIAQNL